MSVSFISLVNCGLQVAVKSKGKTLNCDLINFALYLAFSFMRSSIPPISISINKNNHLYKRRGETKHVSAA